ncbi:alpha/beta-hydrolase family protein [Tsukamurella paurometabola]|uniref:Alpha/beta-hydrolase family protein n=1 Tax=Tsukamurella paurometabola TaxID=2061 RepID=A0ABS5N837_TSUPA|nr:alpha/beta-hydrolase family protein [Tsukamurella paurometabola]MBS4100411.1 alpha/beta-hydrolase family protein [Tsukamurella paurometabola]
MIARPHARGGVLTGYAVGVACALFPNQLPRTVLVQIVVCLLLGSVGALVGWIAVRRREPSDGGGRAALYLGAAALVGWVLWQNHLRAAAGAEPVGPPAFAALVCAVAAAPLAVAVVWPVRARAAAAALAGVAVLGGVAWPATATSAESASYADRFAGIETATRGVRAYASLGDGASPTARAAVAVDRLIAAGGLARRAVVIAVPTGSGWVDPHFVRGVEESLHGDSAIVAVQYTEMPSWQSFVLHRDAAAASTAALIDELHRRAPSTPVRVYGQSLGTVGVLAAQRRASELHTSVAATLQVGTPAGVAIAGPAQLNASDPVGIWSPRLLFAPPSRPASGSGRATPRPPWLPVLSFVQATVDLLGATAPPPGLGHRYDERQGSELVADLVTTKGLPTPV